MDIKIVNGTYDSNTFVIGDKSNVLICDSGATVTDVVKAVAKRKVLGIFVTHEHFDHLTNCCDYARKFNAPIYAAKEVLDNLMYYKPVLPGANGVNYDIAELDESIRFVVISDENEIQIGNMIVYPYLLPGHSPGSIVYQINDIIFTGDLLFARGVGNTLFMTNGVKYMAESLKRLKDEIKFKTAYHGHGESSSWEWQQKNISVWLKWLIR